VVSLNEEEISSLFSPSLSLSLSLSLCMCVCVCVSVCVCLCRPPCKIRVNSTDLNLLMGLIRLLTSISFSGNKVHESRKYIYLFCLSLSPAPIT
jgi:ABC-type polysaccharide/polyol phosphate export permease